MIAQRKRQFKFVFIFFCLTLLGFTEPTATPDLKQLVTTLKEDPRGPYRSIRWFCPDGTILPPKERCPQPGGIQHAQLKDVVKQIQQEHGIYLGQILAGTNFPDFLDAGHQNSRLKQYQLANYLQAVDDGWIMRRARFYRGAVQAEDEESWGIAFLNWLLAKDDLLDAQFSLCRQICKDIPHAAHEDRATRIRALAKSIADSLQAFMNIRVKIHGKPDATDLHRVRAFHHLYENKLSSRLNRELTTLEGDLESVYQKVTVQSLRRYQPIFPANTSVGFQLRTVIDEGDSSRTDSLSGAGLDRQAAPSLQQTASQNENLAKLLWIIRKQILAEKNAAVRLIMLDLSIETENVLFREIYKWKPETIRQLLQKNYVLAEAAAGCGFFEIWEWEHLEGDLSVPGFEKKMTLDDYLKKTNDSRRAVEWASGMVKAVYNPVVTMYADFEPLASGFIDDRIRSSILLPLGEVAGEISNIAATFSNLSNDVLGIASQNDIRGMNPGIAVGELEVVNGLPDDINFSADKIYILSQTPADLKPVAGIATVSEGNAVSHVQLLARNLGIPNAVVTLQNLQALAAFSGTKVFYAVSPQGKVIMKPASEMTPEEKSMLADLQKNETKIVVPTNKINLEQTNLLDLRTVRATDSGRICGPKAANLGQLKSLFPDKVSPGLVIPFGVFRNHLNQQMPGTNLSYWQFLQRIFSRSLKEKKRGVSDQVIEQRVLSGLAQLRAAIRTIRFLPDFKERLEKTFHRVFNADIGHLPVFIRSDTNMEDLPNFTGAGLNLTVGNILQQSKIFKAIRDVWASPFTERSYRWRQKYLENPANVYPSLLVLQSVNAEKSGVMITTGVSSSDSADITVAFDWGVGGAVAGQAAETYLLRHDGADVLLAPAREVEFNFLPLSGGIEKKHRYFNQPILNRAERHKLRVLAEEISRKLPGTPGIRTNGPYDVELGFWNESIWLFQVRPFVENKLAQSSAYLSSLDSTIPGDMQISLSEKIGTH